MRLPLSFVAACLVALALFSLMLSLIAPPGSKVPDDPLSVGHFVRIGAPVQSRAGASRQPAPDMPQAEAMPQPPTPATPAAVSAAPAPKLPSLALEAPALSSRIGVARAPAPSLEGLAAAPAASRALSTAAGAASGGSSAGAVGAAGGAEGGAGGTGPAGGPESEVMPLNDVRPRYPQMALQRGIEGYVKLAFTINRAGAVENIRVLEASPLNVFEREARAAAARWRFAPRTENGRAVDREAVKTLYFRIQRGP
ncbi:energy transducer TonB [Azotobacter beijerinckii]|uniref:Protein TonB n=1 Tax=Azotobacter beijerinckii TaxID=170623 RepID=A0A1I3ZAW7_9GAMM|nr:energy transducer TonB [Azotobacter beijerinckii]SFA81064.1 protein TonB [Azotobacter beijerinckii]SFK41318.1 protein TonB [Azotobacter beijerinckii]